MANPEATKKAFKETSKKIRKMFVAIIPSFRIVRDKVKNWFKII